MAKKKVAKQEVTKGDETPEELAEIIGLNDEPDEESNEESDAESENDTDEVTCMVACAHLREDGRTYDRGDKIKLSPERAAALGHLVTEAAE